MSLGALECLRCGGLGIGSEDESARIPGSEETLASTIQASGCGETRGCLTMDL